MNYLSVCSGIEAATVAWHHMGWNPIGFSEIEKFPSAVLDHHYPHVTNYGDMTLYKDWNLNGTIKLLVGGTPCQSFSVAGLRKGLDDPRGNLALVYLGIAEHFKPRWIVWENVPGVLSSSGGRDFGSFLGALAELGYGFSYRVLDAQFFGVAQRRRRVFVVGHLGDWRPSAAVLFEPESLLRNSKPSRETGKRIAGYVESSFGQYRGDSVAGTTKASGGVLGGGSETFVTVYENHGTDSRINEVSVCPTVTARWGTGGNNVPLAHESIGCNINSGTIQGDIAATLTTASQIPNGSGPKIIEGAVGFDSYNLTETGDINQTIKSPQGGVLESIGGVRQNMAVRRLTPIECERLQGFPDLYTNIPWRNKDESPDSLRYKALGNSMAVPVMRWIGEKIQRVDAMLAT